MEAKDVMERFKHLPPGWLNLYAEHVMMHLQSELLVQCWGAIAPVSSLRSRCPAGLVFVQTWPGPAVHPKASGVTRARRDRRVSRGVVVATAVASQVSPAASLVPRFGQQKL